MTGSPDRWYESLRHFPWKRRVRFPALSHKGARASTQMGFSSQFCSREFSESHLYLSGVIGVPSRRALGVKPVEVKTALPVTGRVDCRRGSCRGLMCRGARGEGWCWPGRAHTGGCWPLDGARPAQCLGLPSKACLASLLRGPRALPGVGLPTGHPWALGTGTAALPEASTKCSHPSALPWECHLLWLTPLLQPSRHPAFPHGLPLTSTTCGLC